MNELYKKYRPSSFKRVIGQPSVVAALNSMLKKQKVPHAMLISGPSGVGKTTIARILKNKLNCSDHDFYEMNCADFNGIDMVRDIRRNVLLAPIGGECRIWLIDECFSENTPIRTPYGDIPIKDLCSGDVVFNIQGEATVQHVSKNKVRLNRVVKLKFSNGIEIYTTKEHEFLTDSGWIKAIHLKESDCIYRKSSKVMCNQRSNKHANMPAMQTGVQTNTLQQAQVLLKKMWTEIKTKEHGERSVYYTHLYRMPNTNADKKIEQESVLYNAMCGETLQNYRTKKSCVLKRSTIENVEKNKAALQNKGGNVREKKVFRTYEEKQPITQSKKCRENEKNKNKKWNFLYVAKCSWWKRTAHRSTAKVMESVREALGIRNSDTNRTQSQKGQCIPIQLQSGHSGHTKENSHRSRWERTQAEKKYIARCKKDKTFEKVRVESIEVYQSGYNNKSFEGVIKSKERVQGFVEFYDLQIQGHPSYFANGVPVHNCHMLTTPAQNAFLKLLEDTPKHVYFILATTDPKKLLKTIKTRCTELKLKNVPPKIMTDHLKSIVAAEKKSVKSEVLEKISESSDGSVRMALVMLDKIIDVEGPETQIELIESAGAEVKGFQIARALMDTRTTWNTLAALLKTVEDEPETIRWIVLGYCNTVMLSAGRNTHRAAVIIESFREPFYNSKKAGLAYACFEVINGQ